MNASMGWAAFGRRVCLFTTGGLLACMTLASANLTVTGTTNDLALADALLAADGGGVSNLAIVVSGHSTNDAVSSGTYTVSQNPDVYGLTTDGIVLSTGNVGDYSSGANSTDAQNTAYGVAASGGENTLLSPISGTTSNFDVTTVSLTFDVQPGVTNLSVSFVFGSEEFPEGALAEKDGFAIYLNGTNIGLVNSAVVNSRHTSMAAVTGTELDGVIAPNSSPVTVSFPVTSGSLGNTLVFIIGDSNDDVTDSTVYLTNLRQTVNEPPPSDGVDLEGEWTEVTTKCKEKNETTSCKIKGRIMISNDGPGAAPTSRVEFYLSDNDQFDESDELVKEVSTGTVKPEKPKNKTASVKSNAAVTGRYLIAVLDANNEVEETNENNNVVVFGPLP